MKGKGIVRTIDQLMRKYTIEGEIADHHIRKDMVAVKKQHYFTIRLTLVIGALIGFVIGYML